jgi:signal transduction histidine kinase/DNA-binding response OmpR family regulator/CHASE3 domain sensor protein
LSKKSKSVKAKVITGYILLFLIGMSSMAFLYNEILKANQPKEYVTIQNQLLIGLSDALATLYEAETSGRHFDLIASEKGFYHYNQMIDSAIHKMQHLKGFHSESHDIRLDSIAMLLAQKKESVAKIRVLNHQYNSEIGFENAKKQIAKARDSLRKNAPKINNPTGSAHKEFREFISEILSPKQLDSLSRLEVKDEEILTFSDKKLSDLITQEYKLKQELQKKERALYNENLFLSNKIRFLLSSIEKEVLDSTYAEILQKEQDMERTTQVLLWMGVVTVCLLLIFGSIILRDLTRQQNYREKLEVLNKENSALLRSKTMLLATVTHDMQSPLGSILGFSDLLKKTTLNETQNQYVKNISYSSDYILSLVNDLVDFSKLENDKIKIEKVSYNPQELIENVFNSLKKSASDKGIILLYSTEDELNTNLISDPYRIRQILTNLVTNAIKFTPNGHVKITGKKEKGNLILEVEDTGIGMTQHEQSIVFEEFTQAHSDIEKQFGGTGLGLTISKRMAELLGGTIHIKSEKEKGSVFSLILPFDRDISTEKTKKEPVEIDTNFLKDKKIIIVDDDSIQLSLMEALFENYPIKLTTLNDATKVIPLLMEEDFDLIFTDIQMPKKSGYVLVEKIRNHPKPEIKNIPVVALSGKRDSSPEDFIDKGFTYFVGKPARMDEIIQVMEFIFKGGKVPVTTPEKPIEKTGKLYDLSSLKQFIGDDKEALTKIISVFLESTKTNSIELEDSIGNPNKLAETAHRMLPMFRQIESWELALLLEKLEYKKVPKKETAQFVEDFIRKLNILTSELQKEL